MSVTSETVRFGQDNVWSGYFCRVERAGYPMPAVLLIQEIWGVDDHLEDVAGRLARAGYAVLAPDLFARHGTRQPGMARAQLTALQQFMNDLPPAAWQDSAARDRAVDALPEPRRRDVAAAIAAVFDNKVVRRLESHLDVLRAGVSYLHDTRPETTRQRVGCVGFCIGGGLSGLLATYEPRLSAAIVFYGAAPPVDRVSHIACPILGLYGQNDPRVNGTLPPFIEAMERAHKPLHTYMYTGAGHAFFNDTRPSYHVGAARDANVRMLSFFAQHLSLEEPPNRHPRN